MESIMVREGAIIQARRLSAKSAASQIPQQAVITQEKIREYLIAKEWIAREKQLYKQLAEMLNAGAVIEQGPLGIKAVDVQQRPLNSKTLTRLKGKEWVAELRRCIEPIDVQSLFVS